MIQTKDSNLTFRPLTIDDAEQYNALLRYAFQVTEQELSESGWKDDEIKQSNSRFSSVPMCSAVSARRIWYHSSRFIRWT
jgi:hypothetical protein